MTYKRYKSNITLSKQEKVELMAEYINYYDNLIKECGLDVLNIKIPREVFGDVLDSIGTILIEQSIKMANEDGPVKEFLQANPLPPNMKELIPDDFRAFTLLLNSLKQWVSAESAATDRFILGGTAKATCKAAVDKCIVTGKGLGDNPELHHPMRDGRPPILLSKNGHVLIEQNNQNAGSEKIEDDEVWKLIKQIRSESHMSWVQLREGCVAIITYSNSYRPGAKSFANKVIRETGLEAMDVIEMLDKRGLGL